MIVGDEVSDAGVGARLYEMRVCLGSCVSALFHVRGNPRHLHMAMSLITLSRIYSNLRQVPR